MTASASTKLYTQYKRFGVSRVNHWRPKIYQNLLTMIQNATDEPTIEAAIKQLDFNMLKPSGLAVTLDSVYKDAGRVWGGTIYLAVMKQAKKKVRNPKSEIANLQLKRRMPIGFNEELIAQIISSMRLHNLEMVTEITDTMKDWILENLILGQQEGKSIREVADELVKHAFPKNRAMTIARTETLKAANFGAMQGAKATGFKMEKEWISSRDIRTRRTPRDEFSHIAMDGKTVPMDQPFLVPNRNGSHDNLQQPLDPKGNPGDVINCRCTVGFNVVRDARGLPVRL